MHIIEAFETFKPDDLDKIIEEFSADLQEELRKERDDAAQLGTTWIADEVRKLRIEYHFGDRIQYLKRLAQYHKNMRIPKRPGQITDIDIARAKEFPIEELYQGKLHKVGGKFKYVGLCPFHNDRKNAAFYIDIKNQYHCFTCAAHGDSINFYMKTFGATFIQSIKYLAKV